MRTCVLILKWNSYVLPIPFYGFTRHYFFISSLPTPINRFQSVFTTSIWNSEVDRLRFPRYGIVVFWFGGGKLKQVLLVR